mmetsp:Transcript_6318/g.8133  ORF Transcript_6318/g.8133 Transcript_6318/m.8133 type:complete len:97 (+) Transcript_6318:193-483(+)
MILSTGLVSLACVVSLLARYIDTEMFPIEAYFVIGIAFWFGFMSIGLLAVDLGFTLHNQVNNDLEDQQKLDRVMVIMWNVVYWGNMIMGSLVIKFY